MVATFHTYGRLLHHTQYARSRWFLYTARRCTTQLWIYDSFDDCWFAKHCTISVFKMSRPTDFQKLSKHFHILQFMKCLRGAHFLHLGCQGGRCAPLPPVSYATAGYCCQRNDFVVTIAVRWSNFFLCRKGKALCKRPFEWHRQQPEKYKQNFDVSLPGKITADAHRKGAWGHSNESLSITAVHNTA